MFGLITMTMLYGFINSGQQEIIDDVIAQRDSCQNMNNFIVEVGDSIRIRMKINGEWVVFKPSTAIKRKDKLSISSLPTVISGWPETLRCDSLPYRPMKIERAWDFNHNPVRRK